MSSKKTGPPKGGLVVLGRIAGRSEDDVFVDRHVDVGGVDDRRGGGMGMPIALGGGGGIVGLVLLVLFQVLGGGDAQSLVPTQVGTGGATETTEQLRQRCN